MKVKICGITNKKDAQDAIYLGADAIGFIFYKNSKRYVSPEIAEEISLFCPPFVSRVGVFVNMPLEEVDSVVQQCNLDYVQLHGDEDIDYCIKCNTKVIKVFRIENIEDISEISKYQGVVSSILLDTKSKELYGGTGKHFDWGIAIAAKEYQMPMILSGGLNAENIEKAIQIVDPFAVDLNSGVETEPGKKDYHKINSIIQLIKNN